MKHNSCPGNRNVGSVLLLENNLGGTVTTLSFMSGCITTSLINDYLPITVLSVVFILFLAIITNLISYAP